MRGTVGELTGGCDIQQALAIYMWTGHAHKPQAWGML